LIEAKPKNLIGNRGYDGTHRRFGRPSKVFAAQDFAGSVAHANASDERTFSRPRRDQQLMCRSLRLPRLRARRRYRAPDCPEIRAIKIKESVAKSTGWGARIRTWEWRNQKSPGQLDFITYFLPTVEKTPS